MPIIMPDEQMPPSALIVMIVGTPGSFKSSLAMTAKKAIHIDGDRGAKRAIRKCPTMSITTWDEVKNEEAAGTFKNFSTVIIDTPKSVIDDFMWSWSQRKQYFADDRKVYGKVGEEFKRFVAELRLLEVDLIIVSHEKSKDVNDKVVYEPNITGQSKDLLIRMCDQVGFVEKREIRDKNGKNILQSVITFYPTPAWPFCKNTARLEDIVIPDFSDSNWSTFFEDKVMTPTRNAIAAMSAEQKEALDIIADWQSAIDCIVEDGRDVNAELQAIGKDYAEQVPQEHLQKQIRQYLLNHIAKIGYKWDSVSKSFIKTGASTNGQAKAAEKPAEAAPVAETAQAPEAEQEQQSEAIAEAAETRHIEAIDVAADAEQQRKDLGPPPVINKNPNLAPPKDDLFARKD